MIHHERSLELEAAPEAVWAELGRFMHIDEIAPQVTSVEALTEGEAGVGSRRRVFFENGGSVVEEVISWTPDRCYRVRMSDTDPMPLHEAQAELSLTEVETGRTKVTWSMDYRMKYGPFGWLLGQTLMKNMMGKVFDGNLKSLADKVYANESQTTRH